MKIRFSIRWLLLAVAYVSLVAAACTQQHPGWSTVLWLVNWLIVLYLVLVAIFFRGLTQAMAVGFLLFLAAYVAALRWSPESLPTRYIAAWLGVSDLNTAQANIEDVRAELDWEYRVAENAASEEYRTRTIDRLDRMRQQLICSQYNYVVVQTLNAAGAIVAGLVGVVLGAHVWSRAQRQRARA